jgi:ABC-type sugar transport system substrate-binding protein
MNKRGTSFFLILMLAVIFFLLGLALASPLNAVVQESRTTAALNCTNSSIDSYKKGACVITDLYSPYFVGILFGIAGAILGARIV